MQTRRPLAVAILAAVAALAAGLPVPALAEGIDDEIKSFEDYLKTSPDSQGLRNRIAELGLKKDPKVAKALLPLLKDRKMEDDVKIAVAQVIGEQGDKSVVGTLMNMADAKDIEKEKPKLLAALLEGIGDVDAKANYKFLLKAGKKYLDLSADIASAAFRACSLHVTNESVDDMVAELGRADQVFANDSAVKQAGRNGTKPVLMEILKKMTGQDFKDYKAWKTWWDDNKKTWKPSAAGEGETEDLSKIEVLKNSGYGYEFKKPNKAWHFRKNPGGTHHVVILEAMDEGQKAAWVELVVYATKNYKEKSPEQAAQSWRDENEPKFRDFKEAAWDRKCRYGGVNGLEQILVGQHKDDGAVYVHNVFLEDGEKMYMLRGTWKSGKPASMKEDLLEIFKNFKIKN
jgi:hypothetical protein